MKNRLLFLGPPGAGKGTQASQICNDLDLMHLSTGELLRAEVEAKTSLGQEVSLIMNKGELVSDDIVLSIVQNRLVNGEREGWLLDGFPRNLVQAKSLQKLLDELSQKIQAVILIEISDEILIQRLLSRGRPDDNEEAIRKRLIVYKEKTAPLIDFYSDAGILNAIDGEGQVIDVALRIREVLN